MVIPSFFLSLPSLTKAFFCCKVLHRKALAHTQAGLSLTKRSAHMPLLPVHWLSFCIYTHIYWKGYGMMHIFVLTYLALVNLLAVFIVLWDKRKARRGEWRIRESTLLFLAAIGGSLSMYLSMRLIHHKTRHLKFMLGIPILFFLQLLLGAFFWALAHDVFPLPF